MHYSRILASVALVAVSYGAPVADKISSSSTTSSYLPTVTPSGSADNSTSSSAYNPPVATESPIAGGHGAADNKADTYDLAAKDEHFNVTGQNTPPMIAVPPFGTISDAPYVVEGGKDNANITVPEEKGIAFDGKYDFDNVEEPNFQGKNATESGTADVVALDEPKSEGKDNAVVEFDGKHSFDSVGEPKFQADNATESETVAVVLLDAPKPEAKDNVALEFDAKPSVGTVEEPKFQAENAKAIGKGPA